MQYCLLAAPVDCPYTDVVLFGTFVYNFVIKLYTTEMNVNVIYMYYRVPIDDVRPSC